MFQKGFTNIFLIIAILVLTGIASFFGFRKEVIAPDANLVSDTPSLPTTTPPIEKSLTPVITPDTVPSPTPNNPAPKPVISVSGDITAIRTILATKSWTPVIVVLKGNEFTQPYFHDEAKKKIEARKIQDTVLSILTENDFKVYNQFESITAFAGLISTSGLDTLLNNPFVVSIAPDRLSSTY